jgi:hypothetical protein
MIMSLPSREEHGMREFENRTLRGEIGAKGNEMVRGWRKLPNEKLQKFYSWINIIRMLESQKKSWVWQVVRKGRRRTRS